MPTQQRPLSPHLQVYRPQLTSVLSITHRATGVVLSLGLIPLIAWVVALSQGAESFRQISAIYQYSWIGWVWIVWTFALFYHLCNGIRHLLWDAGWLLDLKGAYASGWTVVVVSVALTALSWGVW